jgi:hypothetical protein
VSCASALLRSYFAALLQCRPPWCVARDCVCVCVNMNMCVCVCESARWPAARGNQHQTRSSLRDSCRAARVRESSQDELLMLLRRGSNANTLRRVPWSRPCVCVVCVSRVGRLKCTLFATSDEPPRSSADPVSPHPHHRVVLPPACTLSFVTCLLRPPRSADEGHPVVW